MSWCVFGDFLARIHPAHINETPLRLEYVREAMTGNKI